ncbi:response regulator transcription factor [Pseudomaricurvus alcaniphilus]|uniref:response regulator transcription factor n=1 Tax=Pseudomaricurvus alcaniphilus TaxID=1166482 RepID=UPI001A9FF608|nr:response regulator transcription factor [Pseudomaricurvus alcaniphilus]
MPDITIGLLEDEKPQADLLIGWLTDAGYRVVHRDTGSSFIQTIRQTPADLLILDWQLPDCEGIDVLAEVRNELGFEGPVLFATAKDSEEDVVRGLASGADDYLIKPLRQAELLARLAALWRRVGQDPVATLALGPIVLDLNNKQASIEGETVSLTPTEFQLASCLLTNVGKLLSREFLLRDVWGVGADLDTRTVDVHMSRIRKILKIGPDMGYCIKTIYRHGYRLEAL